MPHLFRARSWAFAFTLLLGSRLAAAENTGAEPPREWIDPATGHRVIRLTDEPGSNSFYFNYNAFSPDGRWMVYTTPKGGISALELATRRTKKLVDGPARTIVVSRRTSTLFYSRPPAADQPGSVWKCDLDTGESRKLVDLPPRATVVAINADDTLGAGTYIEGDADADGAYDGKPRAGGSRISPVNQGEPINKSEMMTRRLNAKLPMTLFTIDLASGKLTKLLEHDTNWLNHLQFSPTDPTLLLYCHEGHWQLVDRIWTIRTDGSQKQLIHRRTMQMEIAGHEWWGADGQTIYYQLHFPRGGRTSFIASYNVATHERTWLQYNAADQSSIHDNSSPDQKLFCGDGDNQSPWIFLFRPKFVNDRGTIGENLIRGGYVESEKLVDMSKHNYRLEPNPMFTPDQKFIIFRSNILGPDYVFAVEIARAAGK
ncbi:MAG: PD40 domain-containing protein [Opitutae bacterium]|nr:PD40 domain-containing protein [Opitutae bacterium]